MVSRAIPQPEPEMTEGMDGIYPEQILVKEAASNDACGTVTADSNARRSDTATVRNALAGHWLLHEFIGTRERFFRGASA